MFQFDAPLDSLPQGHTMQLDVENSQFVQNEIKQLQSNGLISSTTPVPYFAAPFVVNGKKSRMVIDYQNLNSITTK